MQGANSAIARLLSVRQRRASFYVIHTRYLRALQPRQLGLEQSIGIANSKTRRLRNTRLSAMPNSLTGTRLRVSSDAKTTTKMQKSQHRESSVVYWSCIYTFPQSIRPTRAARTLPPSVAWWSMMFHPVSTRLCGSTANGFTEAETSVLHSLFVPSHCATTRLGRQMNGPTCPGEKISGISLSCQHAHFLSRLNEHRQMVSYCWATL
jgi:hypothetical protein